MKLYVEIVKGYLGAAVYRISTYNSKHSVSVVSDYRMFEYMLDKHSHIIDYKKVNSILLNKKVVSKWKKQVLCI